MHKIAACRYITQAIYLYSIDRAYNTPYCHRKSTQYLEISVLVCLMQWSIGINPAYKCSRLVLYLLTRSSSGTKRMYPFLCATPSHQNRAHINKSGSFLFEYAFCTYLLSTLLNKRYWIEFQILWSHAVSCNNCSSLLCLKIFYYNL